MLNLFWLYCTYFLFPFLATVFWRWNKVIYMKCSKFGVAAPLLAWLTIDKPSDGVSRGWSCGCGRRFGCTRSSSVSTGGAKGRSRRFITGHGGAVGQRDSLSGYWDSSESNRLTCHRRSRDRSIDAPYWLVTELLLTPPSPLLRLLPLRGRRREIHVT